MEKNWKEILTKEFEGRGYVVADTGNWLSVGCPSMGVAPWYVITVKIDESVKWNTVLVDFIDDNTSQEVKFPKDDKNVFKAINMVNLAPMGLGAWAQMLFSGVIVHCGELSIPDTGDLKAIPEILLHNEELAFLGMGTFFENLTPFSKKANFNNRLNEYYQCHCDFVEEMLDEKVDEAFKNATAIAADDGRTKEQVDKALADIDEDIASVHLYDGTEYLQTTIRRFVGLHNHLRGKLGGANE